MIRLSTATCFSTPPSAHQLVSASDHLSSRGKISLVICGRLNSQFSEFNTVGEKLLNLFGFFFFQLQMQGKSRNGQFAKLQKEEVGTEEATKEGRRLGEPNILSTGFKLSAELEIYIIAGLGEQN